MDAATLTTAFENVDHFEISHVPLAEDEWSIEAVLAEPLILVDKDDFEAKGRPKPTKSLTADYGWFGSGYPRETAERKCDEMNKALEFFKTMDWIGSEIGRRVALTAVAEERREAKTAKQKEATKRKVK